MEIFNSFAKTRPAAITQRVALFVVNNQPRKICQEVCIYTIIVVLEQTDKFFLTINHTINEQINHSLQLVLTFVTGHQGHYDKIGQVTIHTLWMLLDHLISCFNLIKKYSLSFSTQDHVVNVDFKGIKHVSASNLTFSTSFPHVICFLRFPRLFFT